MHGFCNFSHKNHTDTSLRLAPNVGDAWLGEVGDHGAAAPVAAVDVMSMRSACTSPRSDATSRRNAVSSALSTGAVARRSANRHASKAPMGAPDAAAPPACSDDGLASLDG